MGHPIDGICARVVDFGGEAANKDHADRAAARPSDLGQRNTCGPAVAGRAPQWSDR
jgi:hypothetical protein